MFFDDGMTDTGSAAPQSDDNAAGAAAMPQEGNESAAQ